MGRWIALAAALAGALFLGWQGSKTPAPARASAPATAFSAERALVDIRMMAQTPHPTGSAANAKVRDALVARMTALGLSPTVQVAPAVESRPWNGDTYILGATVENIVGVLPGRDRAKPALALMAHYDSVPGSPGAADDAAGVAAALEIVRALKAGGPIERDVIILITDGEEAGLLGARAFFADHPLRKRIGLLINMEARGSGGRASMFQTGPGNGELIAAFAKSATRPSSNSMAVFLYENMPNDTDFTVSKEAGINGLNFAFIGRQFDYHSPTATVSSLDPGSVQHLGEQGLAAAALFARAPDLPRKTPDAVYSQTFGDHILAYPAWGGWIVLLVAGGLVTLAAARGRRAGTVRLPDTLRGFGAALFLLVAAALALQLARRATGVAFDYMARDLLAQWPVWETTLVVVSAGMLLLVPVLAARGARRLWIAGASLAAGLLCSAFGGWDPVGCGLGVTAAVLALASFGRPAALAGAWLGVMATGLLVGIALQIAAPAIGFLAAWPLTLAALGAAATGLGERRGPIGLLLLAVLAALVGGWLAENFHGVALGMDMPPILSLFVWLAALAFWPLAAGPTGSAQSLRPALVMLLAGVALVAFVRFNDPWTERHPRVATLLHVEEPATGKAWRVSQDAELAPWTRAALGGDIVRRPVPPIARRDAWTAPTKSAALPAQTIESIVEPDGRVRLRVRPPAGARALSLDLRPDMPIDGIVVQGRVVDAKLKPGAWAHVRWVVAPDGLEIVFRPARPGGGLEIRHAALTDGWPSAAAPLSPRPADLMPFDISDSAVVIGASTVRW